MIFMFFSHLLPPPPYFFFFNDTAPTEIYTLSLHDALPISASPREHAAAMGPPGVSGCVWPYSVRSVSRPAESHAALQRWKCGGERRILVGNRPPIRPRHERGVGLGQFRTRSSRCPCRRGSVAPRWARVPRIAPPARDRDRGRSHRPVRAGR